MKGNRIIVRLKSNISLAGYKINNFRDESLGFWLEVNENTRVKYYIPFNEVQEIIDRGEHITFVK